MASTQPAGIDTAPNLTTSFTDGVKEPQDDHYTAHDTECEICGEAKEADPSVIIEPTPVSTTAVVQTEACIIPHVFHKLCLYIWLHSKLREDEDGTCPKCRHTLVLSRISLMQDILRQTLEEAVAYTDTIIEEQTGDCNWIAANIVIVEELIAAGPEQESLLVARDALLAGRERILSRLSARVENKARWEADLVEIRRLIEARASA
jgi:hypothetical protein